MQQKRINYIFIWSQLLQRIEVNVQNGNNYVGIYPLRIL